MTTQVFITKKSAVISSNIFSSTYWEKVICPPKFTALFLHNQF
ncbi:hypothetical protein [uncultured Aggregatibacter sp.]|nr:hypothetical protein [uncultured Aggregatibacter sp.]